MLIHPPEARHADLCHSLSWHGLACLALRTPPSCPGEFQINDSHFVNAPG